MSSIHVASLMSFIESTILNVLFFFNLPNLTILLTCRECFILYSLFFIITKVMTGFLSHSVTALGIYSLNEGMKMQTIVCIFVDSDTVSYIFRLNDYS